MAGLHFEITADNRNFQQRIEEVRRNVKAASNDMEKEGAALDSAFSRLKTAAAGIGAAFGAQSLIRDIVRVRGEIQQLNVAFTTMLQSEEKADRLMAEAVEFAAKTPFDLQGIASGIRQLLAYGTAAEDAIKDVEMLGNVAAGLSVPLNDMIYLYGTLRSQGRAYTVDIRQFAGRGVPIYEELSKVLGVTVEQVNELISAGKVGFAEVEQAFRNMTSEGGMFYNLMGEQSKTITGQISNLKDNFDMMLNDIGEKSEGVINGAISGASYLVEHYRDLLKVLGTLAAAYGGYKATLILVAAAQRAVVAAGNISAWLSLAKGIRSAKDAMVMLNLATKANPIGLIAGAVAGLVAGISALVRKQKEVREEIEAAVKPLQDEYVQVNDLVARLKDANTKEDERLGLLNQLKEIAPEVAEGIDGEAESLGKLNENLETYNSMQLAEIAVKRFSMESDFDKAVEDMESAKTKLQQEAAGLYDVYSELYARFAERSAAGELPRSSLSLSRIFDSADSIEEKTKRLFSFYEINSRVYHGMSTQEVEKAAEYKILFRGLDIDDYSTALDKYEAREDEYAEHAQELSDKIRSIATAVFPDRERQDTFISRMFSAYGLEGAPVLESDDKSDEEATILPKNFDEQVAEAKKKVSDLKKGLSDLKNGVLPGDAKADFDFASAIEETEKALKEAEERYDLLTGRDTKTEERAARERKNNEEKAAKELLNVQKRIADEEYELKRASTDDKLELIRLEKEHALKELQEEHDAVKEIYAAAELPTDEIDARYRKLEELVSKSYDAKADKEMSDRTAREAKELQSLLKEYETYEQARLRIQKEYAEKRKSMQNADGTLKAGVTQGNMDNLGRSEAQDLDDLALHYAMLDSDFERWTGELASKTSKVLRSMLAEASARLAELEGAAGTDPDDIMKAKAAVVALTDALDKAKNSTDSSEAKWTDLNEVLKNSADIFTELGEKIPGAAGEILSGIGNIATAAVSMASAIRAVGEAVSAAEKASAILAVISTALKALSFVTDIFNANREANEAAAQAAHEYALALEEINYQQRRLSHESVFGDNPLGLFYENADIAVAERAKIRDVMDSLYNRTKDSGGSGVKWEVSVSGPNSNPGLDGFDDIVLGNPVLPVTPEVVGNYEITSDMRSGWQKFWGSKKNIATFNLADFVGDDGAVNVEGLQNILEQWGKGLSDSDRQMVEDLIAHGEQYAEAMEGITSYVGSLFGDLKDSIADSMITAFEETGDAADATFDDIRQSIAKNFAKNAIINMVSGIFDEEAQSKMAQLIGSDDAEGALAYLDTLMSEVERLAPAVNETLKGLYGEYANSASEDSERTSASKGIAQASQDSIDELNGRATAIQSHTYSINEGIRSLVSTSAVMLDRLTGIENNTSHLETIDDNMLALRKEMDGLRTDLTQRGIKLK